MTHKVMHLKMTEHVHERLRDRAQRERRSMHNLANVIIESYLDYIDIPTNTWEERGKGRND